MDSLIEFKKLYNKFISRKGATPIVSLNYFKELLPYMTAFRGEYAGRTLEINFVIHDGQIAKGFYKVRDESVKDSKLLNSIGSVIIWEILMHFQRQGYQTFDLGGLQINPAIQYFKLSFGGDVIPTYSYEAALTPLARAMIKIKKIIEQKIRRLYHIS
ncbi:MAG: hypothetical protein A3K23_01070 [Desulfobacca sp. RBG_16_58_9]|nr:MAG: hypothetical protein A3K23_01070 [Desulfobacca sp. RBG_16_58_9]